MLVTRSRPRQAFLVRPNPASVSSKRTSARQNSNRPVLLRGASSPAPSQMFLPDAAIAANATASLPATASAADVAAVLAPNASLGIALSHSPLHRPIVPARRHLCAWVLPRSHLASFKPRYALPPLRIALSIELDCGPGGHRARHAPYTVMHVPCAHECALAVCALANSQSHLSVLPSSDCSVCSVDYQRSPCRLRRRGPLSAPPARGVHNVMQVPCARDSRACAQAACSHPLLRKWLLALFMDHKRALSDQMRQASRPPPKSTSAR